jgi:hypothetical protein
MSNPVSPQDARETVALPCPFCGALPKGIEKRGVPLGSRFLIRCLNERCPVQPFVQAPEEDVVLYRWNTRALLPRDDSLREAIQQAYLALDDGRIEEARALLSHGVLDV